MYVYGVYPAISKSPKQLPNCLKIAETSIVLVVFNDVSAYAVTVSFFHSTWITQLQNNLGYWNTSCTVCPLYKSTLLLFVHKFWRYYSYTCIYIILVIFLNLTQMYLQIG